MPHDAEHIAFSKLLDNDGKGTPPEIDLRTDIAVLQYTGGTTGVSKGAMLTHANLYANTYQARMWTPDLEPGRERMMGVLPFFHVFAMTAVMNLTIALGGSIVMRPRFELDPVLEDVTRKKPTLFPGVPTMYTAIINHPKLEKFDLTSIKVCLSGRRAPAGRDQAPLRDAVGLQVGRGLRAHRNLAAGHCQPLQRAQQGGLDRPAGARHLNRDR